jgi:hypothetical protein
MPKHDRNSDSESERRAAYLEEYEEKKAALAKLPAELIPKQQQWTKVYYGEDGIIVTDGYTAHKFALTLKGTWIYAQWRIRDIIHVSEPNMSERRIHDTGAFDD